MLTNCYIPWLSNYMKIAVAKNNLRGQIWYRSSDPDKNQRPYREQNKGILTPIFYTKNVAFFHRIVLEKIGVKKQKFV